jgi:hypothetical protein
MYAAPQGRYSSELGASLKEGIIFLKNTLTRQRVFYMALNRSERSIIHLVLRLDLKPTGRELVRAIVGIMAKAQAWFRLSKYQVALKRGREMAEVNVAAAVSWGLLEAKSWLLEREYVLLLGLNDLNMRG